MIEKILHDYLSENTDVPVYLDRFQTDETCIVIEKTGSSRENQIDRATFAMQSYADSMYNAAALNETLKSLMMEAVNLPEIASVDLNSDYDFTDTTTKHYRYQAVFEITYYRS